MNTTPTARSLALAAVFAFLFLPRIFAETVTEISHPTFSDSNHFRLRGSAAIANGVLNVTPATSYTSGAAWHEDAFDVGDGFNAAFSIAFEEQSQAGLGTDGIAFVMQSASTGSVMRIGDTGGDLGLWEGPDPVVNSVAVTFETYRKSRVTVWHIDGSGNGTQLARMDAPTGERFFNTEAIHDVEIIYDSESHSMSLHVPGFKLPIMLSLDIAGLLGSDEVIMGFTAGTGEGHQEHAVYSFEVAQRPGFAGPAAFIPEVPPLSVAGETGERMSISVPVHNLSLDETLVITGASSLSGEEADVFTIVTDLPLNIAPGESGAIVVEAQTEVGESKLYNATLELETNSGWSALQQLSVDLAARALPPETDFIHLPDFGGLETLSLTGAAELSGSQIALTPSSPYVAGAAWLEERVDLTKGFTALFDFRLSNFVNTGADGFALVFQGASDWDPRCSWRL